METITIEHNFGKVLFRSFFKKRPNRERRSEKKMSVADVAMYYQAGMLTKREAEILIGVAIWN